MIEGISSKVIDLVAIGKMGYVVAIGAIESMGEAMNQEELKSEEEQFIHELESNMEEISPIKQLVQDEDKDYRKSQADLKALITK